MKLLRLLLPMKLPPLLVPLQLPRLLLPMIHLARSCEERLLLPMELARSAKYDHPLLKRPRILKRSRSKCVPSATTSNMAA